MDMSLPGKYEPVDNDRLAALAAYYGKQDILDYVALHGWPKGDVFFCNGCNCFPEAVDGDDIYEDCFWHDVRYWIGMKSDKGFRCHADIKLAVGVSAKGHPNVAAMMFAAVRLFAWPWFGRLIMHHWGRGRRNR